MIGKLVVQFKSEGEDCAKNVLTNIDWYIIPLLNPDGYEFSHTSDRFWRKNRRPPPEGSQCYGVDLNRNFDIGYGLGASTNPCEEVYQGPASLSEPEVLALISLGERLNSSLLSYISLHAYGQSWLTPWGYKTGPVDNMEALVEVARAAFKEVRWDREEIFTASCQGRVSLWKSPGAGIRGGRGSRHLLHRGRGQ